MGESPMTPDPTNQLRHQAEDIAFSINPKAAPEFWRKQNGTQAIIDLAQSHAATQSDKAVRAFAEKIIADIRPLLGKNIEPIHRIDQELRDRK